MLSALTPPKRLRTDAKFPAIEYKEGNPELELSSSGFDKISIESCAELLDYRVRGSRFGVRSDPKLLHDQHGQPMVLSIGTDKHVYLCAYVNGGYDSWFSSDITPTSTFQATVFNAVRSISGRQLYLVTCGYEEDQNVSKVYQAIVDCPNLCTTSRGKVDPSSLPKIKWTAIGDTISTRNIQALAIGTLGESLYRVVAAVDATSDKEGSYFTFDTSNPQQGWTIFKLAQQVEKVRSCVHGNVPKLGKGEFVMFEDKSKEKNVACLFQSVDGGAKGIFLTGLGQPESLSTSTNEKGLTDLWIASNDGIGYVNHQKLGEPAEKLLEGIAFSKVFAVESKAAAEGSVVLAYALSKHDELYVVQGTRSAQDKKIVQFEVSGVPIRTGVRAIAGHINPQTGASEVIYIKKGSDSLFHLARDPVSSMWRENELVVKLRGMVKTTKIAAYVINVSFSNGKGIAVPAGYQVQLTSAPCLAYINDRTYNLDRRPQTVVTNRYGRLQIVLPLTNSIGASAVGIRFLPESSETRVFNVQPAQRMINALSAMNTAEKLKDAKSSDGRSLFSEASKREHKDKFNDVAQVLNELPTMISVTSGNEAADHEKQPAKEEIVVTWKKTDGQVCGTDQDWMEAATEIAGDVVGDCIEFLKSVVKGVVKVAFKVIGPVIKFFIKIGTKVIRFVLDTVGKIVTGLAQLIEGAFGIDLSVLAEFFKFHYQKVQKTQEELTFMIECAMVLGHRYLAHIQTAVENGIDEIGKHFEKLIGSPANLPQGQTGQTTQSPLESFLNNPIISNLMQYNPISWLMEATSEELAQFFEIPSLDLKIGQQVWKALNEQLAILWSFFKRSWEQVRGAINEPVSVMEKLQAMLKDAFWTIFDAIKVLVLRVFDLFLNSYESITNFCKGTWNVPFLTEPWEDLTGSNFTLINFMTYMGAQVIELINDDDKSFGERSRIREVVGKFKTCELPPLFPESKTSNGDGKDKGKEDISNGSVVIPETPAGEQRKISSAISKTVRVEEMTPASLNRTTTLDTTTTPKPTTNGEEMSPEELKLAAELILGFARFGKIIFRGANLAIQGGRAEVAAAKADADQAQAQQPDLSDDEIGDDAAGGDPAAPAVNVAGHGGPADAPSVAPARNVEPVPNVAPAPPSRNVTGNNRAVRASNVAPPPNDAPAAPAPNIADNGGAAARPRPNQGNYNPRDNDEYYFQDVARRQNAGGGAAGPPVQDFEVRSLVIVMQVFYLVSVATERLILDKHYDRQLTDYGKHDGNMLEFGGGIIGLAVNFCSSKPYALAIANFANCLGATCSHSRRPKHDAVRFAATLGSATQSISCGLFMINEPNCRAIGWIGVCSGMITELLPMAEDLL